MERWIEIKGSRENELRDAELLVVNDLPSVINVITPLFADDVKMVSQRP